MNYQLEDVDILSGKGISKQIGRATVVIQQLSFACFFDIYVPMMSRMIKDFSVLLSGIDFMALDHYMDKTRLQNFADQFQLAFANRKLRNYYIKILKRCKMLKGMSVRYFKKHCKVDDLIEIFMGLYLFNTEGLKKKLVSMMEKMAIAKTSLSQTSITNWIDEAGSQSNAGAGLAGKLKPRFRRYRQ